MRIIGGQYRGKKLFSPLNGGVRPTADRAREALFNILYSRLGSLSQTDVLDVFAGTGAFAFEALSRGAASVTLMDIRPDTAKRNATLFPAETAKIRIVSADALKCPRAFKACNLIFSDAPYDKGLSVPAVTALARQGWIADEALVLIETRRDEEVTLEPCFEQTDERLYGPAKIGFYVFKKDVFDKKGCL
jgi:16S rRNA (guanine966-N2)-methyltransferase